MPRTSEAITADLDKILGTLKGLRTGFAIQKPLIALKLGAPTAALVDRVVGQILDVHETIAVVLKDLDDRTLEITEAQRKMAKGIEDALRVLA
jgi:hypothetical protein